MTTTNKLSLDQQGKDVVVTVDSATTDKSEHMTAYELSRWCAMLDAVEVIDKKLAQLKMSSSNSWVKPIAIQKYVDEKYQDILYDILTSQECDQV